MDQKPLRTVSSADDISKLRRRAGSETSTPSFTQKFPEYQVKLQLEQKGTETKKDSLEVDDQTRKQLKKEKAAVRSQIMIEDAQRGMEGSKNGGETNKEGSEKPVEMGNDDKIVRSKDTTKPKDTTKIQDIEELLPGLAKNGVPMNFFVLRYRGYKKAPEAKEGEAKEGEAKEGEAKMPVPLSRRSKAVSTMETLRRRETGLEKSIAQMIDDHNPVGTSTTGSTLEYKFERANVNDVRKRLKAAEEAALKEQQRRQKEQSEIKQRRQNEIKNLRLNDAEKQIISDLEASCEKMSILDFFGFLRQKENVDLKALYIKHARYCFEAGVVLATNKEEKGQVRAAIEDIVERGEADTLQDLWHLVKLQNRRNNLKNARYFPYAKELWYNLTLAERVLARQLKKELTVEMGLEALRRNWLEDKYTHKQLEAKNDKHAREYRAIAEKLHSMSEYQRKESNIDYAREKVREEIVEVKTYMLERAGEANYFRRNEQAIQAEKEFEVKLAKDQHALDSKASEHDKMMLIHYIKKQGSHPRLAFIMNSVTLGGVATTALTVAPTILGVYLIFHPPGSSA